MTLKYRGVDYEVAASELHVSEEVIGQYRGATAVRHVATDDHADAHIDGLKYRGAVVR